ncbi:MAG TPA: nucleotide exchange factor GrpE [Gammaproteobacteria bacterium]|nr:nucleotide exchange factor GrpE [Gammaproteobacteria bacterium]
MPEQAADQPDTNKPSQSAPPIDSDEITEEGVSDSENGLRQELELARNKADENWQLFLRTKAELENLRKRTQRDVENAHKYGLERIASELLAVRDSMELGLNTAQEGVELAGLKEGFTLTLKMLTQLMQKFGITEINPEHEKFDPTLHQAITMQESDKLDPNTVISVLQKGYRLQDRLLRPALVTVAKAPDKNAG